MPRALMAARPAGPPVDAILLDHWAARAAGDGAHRADRALAPDLPILILTAQTSSRSRSRRCAPGRTISWSSRSRPTVCSPHSTPRPTAAAARGELRPLSEKIGHAARFRRDRRLGARSSAPPWPIAAKAARARVPVLIEGESGSGKEVDRPGDPRRQPARQEAAGHGQLRRDPRQSRRIRAVRA